MKIRCPYCRRVPNVRLWLTAKLKPGQLRVEVTCPSCGKPFEVPTEPEPAKERA